jgi:pimeloyl-ACP methyl ester carboxylesterase
MLNEPHISAQELHRIHAPVLIEHLVEIYRNLPLAQLSIMPGATHYLHQDHYERFNAIAERFLSTSFYRPTSKQEIERELQEQLQP